MTELSDTAGPKSGSSMIGSITSRIRRAVGVQHVPQGKLGVKLLGHRRYVGGYWDELGRLQFNFLVGQGLQPTDVLVDVACGSLRGGIHFIPYLDPGNYLGIEKESELVRNGLEVELPNNVRVEKLPEVIISSSFEFSEFSKHPTFGLAQSLFSHLPPTDITECFAKLRLQAADGCRFFATFNESSSQAEHDSRGHAHREFRYTQEEMRAFGECNGWSFRYIGDWNHPRGQKMTEFRAV